MILNPSSSKSREIPMPSTTISVQYVNPVKPGKKNGTIKTADGQLYLVDPTQLGQFQPGQTYTIEYDVETSRTGTEWKIFRRMDSGGIHQAPQATTAPGTAGKPSHTQAVEMFTMGVIGRAMQGVGTLPDREILTTWVESLVRAWEDGFARARVSQTLIGDYPGKVNQMNNGN
jgi:hypothetical protein